MRTVALIDESAYGVRTDSGATVGVITAGGTITLTIATILAGIIGGVVYIAIRRWLPWSGIARGLIFGVLMVFGPGFIAIGETDLQIFEPALPIFVMFAALQVLYGLLVALILDRLHPAPLIRPRRRLAVALRGLHYLVAAAICVFAVQLALHIIAGEGTCLTAAPGGGCAVRPSADPGAYAPIDVSEFVAHASIGPESPYSHSPTTMPGGENQHVRPLN
jgi:hypothetical protein